jgi:hypothetical protein
MGGIGYGKALPFVPMEESREEEGKGHEEMEMREEKRGISLTMCFCANYGRDGWLIASRENSKWGMVEHAPPVVWV